MAIKPAFIKSSSVSVNNASTTINVTGNVDCSTVYRASAVHIDGFYLPFQAVSGTSPDGSGNSTITLKEPWPHINVTGASMVVFDTNEGLANAVATIRDSVGILADLDTTALTGDGVMTFDGTSWSFTMVTQSYTDRTFDRLLKTGDGGIGNEPAARNLTLASVDTAYSTGFWTGLCGLHPNASTGDNPFPNDAGSFSMIAANGIQASAEDEYVSQLAIKRTGSSELGWRYKTVSAQPWSGWVYAHSTENLVFDQNVSGSTIANNATTAASNLNTVTTGTWRNVSGGDIANNGYGLWQRI